jgi:two-component system, LytTR family, response regulator
MLTALIIDDEPHNRDTLGKLLERYCPEVTVVGKANGVKSGIEAIRAFHPDLVFLDMNMADGTGFDLLHALAPVNFRVIFVSAMDKDTLRAFRLSGMEYLLKPVSPEELKTGVERVMKSEIKHFMLQLQALEDNTSTIKNRA